MKRKLVSLAVGLMAVGCGGADSVRPGPPQPQPHEALPASFTALLGEYEVVEQDWEPVQGTLSIEATDGEVGFTVSPTPGAESPARPLRLASPRGATSLHEENGEVVHKHVVGPEEKTEIRYAPVDGELWVDALDCRPGICLTYQLIARRPPARN